eukprot:tig00000385_g24754.t1
MFRAPGGGQMLAGKILRVAHHCVHTSKDAHSPRGHDRVCLDEHEDDGTAGIPYYIVFSEALGKSAGFYAHELKSVTPAALEAVGLNPALAADSFSAPHTHAPAPAENAGPAHAPAPDAKDGAGNRKGSVTSTSFKAAAHGSVAIQRKNSMNKK